MNLEQGAIREPRHNTAIPGAGRAGAPVSRSAGVCYFRAYMPWVREAGQ